MFLWLTVDVDLDSLADGGRNVIGGDAHERAHVLPSDLGQGQPLALPRGHALLLTPGPDHELAPVLATPRDGRHGLAHGLAEQAGAGVLGDRGVLGAVADVRRDPVIGQK